MKIENINIVKYLHEALAHATKSGVIQIAVVADKGQNAIAGLFYAPLGKPNELYIIVVQPFGVFLAQRLTVYFKVVACLLSGLCVKAVQQAADPFACIG